MQQNMWHKQFKKLLWLNRLSLLITVTLSYKHIIKIWEETCKTIHNATLSVEAATGVNMLTLLPDADGKNQGRTITVQPLIWWYAKDAL